MTGSSFHYDNQNAKELQRFESPAKVIRTLFEDIWITLKKDIAEIERMLKALIKSLEYKP